MKQCSAYAILRNRDGFVLLTRVEYDERAGTPYVVHVPLKPRCVMHSATEVAGLNNTTTNIDFLLRGTISADEAQSKYGLLIRAETAVVYEES